MTTLRTAPRARRTHCDGFTSSFYGLRFIASLALLLVCSASIAHADAIMRTRAMQAGTIAEYFIEPGRITVQLEIGLGQLEAFKNILPDELYTRAGFAPKTLAARQRGFFARDFAIRPDDGAPLSGELLEIGPRERIRRDEITGEPLPAKDGEEPEIVVHARLAYALEGRPRTLTLSGPPAAGVGFIVYHGNVPVNDFRYLAASQTLKLDWSDPWYTQFDARALRRQYYAPMTGFLYVEPAEVRKEIIIRPLDLQQWIDLGLEGRETIPVEMQPELKRAVGEFLRKHHPVRIDGEAIPPDLAQVNFLERTLRTSRVVDPPVVLDVYSAVLGAIFVYPTTGLPQRVTMEWDLWSARTPSVPVSAVDEAGGMPSLLDAEWNVLEWQNFLKRPTVPTALRVAPPPSTWGRAARGAAWPLTGLAAALAVFSVLRPAARRLPIVLVGVFLAVACIWWGRSATIDDTRASEIVGALLHNVYRAFDYRDEGKIYDVLSESVDGELLTEIFLETRRGLELASQGGARAKVKRVEIVDLHVEHVDGGAFNVETTWNIAGSVGHWGHVHERRNQYHAELRIAPSNDRWKLAGMNVISEERL
jgi:hypothetical protein